MRIAIALLALAGCSSVEVIAPDASGPAFCETIADCPSWLSGQCRTVQCDPTGINNSTHDAWIFGCYTLADPTGTPCDGGMCSGGGCCPAPGMCP